MMTRESVYAVEICETPERALTAHTMNWTEVIE